MSIAAQDNGIEPFLVPDKGCLGIEQSEKPLNSWYGARSILGQGGENFCIEGRFRESSTASPGATSLLCRSVPCKLDRILHRNVEPALKPSLVGIRY